MKFNAMELKTNNMKSSNLVPFPNCDALNGYHCQTNSLAKIYRFHNCPISEDMLLGLGSGMGFLYWHQKGTYPFIGGRSNLKSFFTDINSISDRYYSILNSVKSLTLAISA